MSKAQSLYQPDLGVSGSYRILGSVERGLADEHLPTLKQRISHALNQYPELAEYTITVGKKREEDKWYAEADWTNDIIYLPTHELCPYVTISHELSHLAIKNLKEDDQDVPVTSEEFCSIFTIARMKHENIDRSDISYLGKPTVPKEKWPEICQRALDYREDNRNYIQKCKQWLGIIDG